MCYMLWPSILVGPPVLLIVFSGDPPEGFLPRTASADSEDSHRANPWINRPTPLSLFIYLRSGGKRGFGQVTSS